MGQHGAQVDSFVGAARGARGTTERLTPQEKHMTSTSKAARKSSTPGLQVLSKPDSLAQRFQEALAFAEHMQPDVAACFAQAVGALLLEALQHKSSPGSDTGDTSEGAADRARRFSGSWGHTTPDHRE